MERKTILIRCHNLGCRCWYKLENHSACPKCQTPLKPRGSFYVDFSQDGKRHRIRLKARSLPYAIVETDRADISKLVNEREAEKEKKVRLTVKQAFELWMNDSEVFGCRKRKLIANRPKTLLSKRTSFKTYILPLIGEKHLESVTTDDLLGVIEHWLKTPGERTKRVRSAQSLNLDIRYLRSFFGWARRKGLILIDPTESDRFGFLEEPEKEKEKFGLEEVNAFLRVLRENTEIPLVKRRLIEFWLWTGLRAWSEAASLRWEWVDWKTRTVYIPGENTKSRKGLKRALSDRAWEILEEMRLCGENGSPYVFVNPLTQKPYGDLRKTIRTLTKDAGLDNNITPKDFRHSWISWTDGENALATQEVIGHSGLSVERNYFHMNTDSRRQFENRIAEKMTGCVPNCDRNSIPQDASLASA